MTETTDNKIEGPANAKAQPTAGHAVYVYESAGIAERGGQVPLWLWLVVVSLLVWGIYYLVTYWSAPIVPS